MNSIYSFPLGATYWEIDVPLAELSYAQRRRLVWQTFRPRIKRFTYKYVGFDCDNETSVDRLRDLLVRSKIWLSPPSAFNDPFDSQADPIAEGSTAMKRAKFERLMREHEPEVGGVARRREVDRMMAMDASHWSERARMAITASSAGLGVSCFTDDPRNLLMWSHYARQHQGLTIQFEPLRDHRVFLKAISLDYTRTYPCVNFFDDESMRDSRQIFSKFEDWRYEKERRIVAPGGANQWLPFKADALTGIVVGAKFASRAGPVVQRLLNERQAMKSPDVTIYRATQHRRDYRVTLQRQQSVLCEG